MNKRKAFLGLFICISFLFSISALQQLSIKNGASAKVGYVAASYLSDAIGAEGKVRGAIENGGAALGAGAAVVGTGILAATLEATASGAKLGALLGGPWGLVAGAVVGAV